MPTNTSGGTTTSFSNTPQGNSDTYTYTEEQLLLDGTVYNRLTSTLILDVMSNDLGGNAKSLYSIDDGGTGAMTDLLKSNVTTGWEQTADGNWIRINAGKIEYRIDDGTNTLGSARDVNSLNENEAINDSFVYAIRLGNGTLAMATVTINLTGMNDIATITGTATSTVTEDGDGLATLQTVNGTLTVVDPDSGQNELRPIATCAGDSGHGMFVVNANGTWTYTLNNGDADIQQLAEGETATDTITVMSEDGTATQVIRVTITGTNDVPTVSAVSSAADEDGAAVTGSFIGDDVDSDDDAASLTYAITSDPSEGSVTNNNNGTFSFDPGDAFQDLAEGETRDVTFTYTAMDSHGATSTGGTVTVTVTGTNDVPVISIGVTDSAAAAITESDSGLTASGQLSLSDADTSDTVNVAVSSVAVGGTAAAGAFTNEQLLAMLSLSGDAGNAADGTDGSLGWTFDSGTEAFDHLADGETLVLTYTLTATDSNDGTDTQTVTVTITGTNDAAVIDGDLTGTAAEDGLGASGDSRSTDVDNDDDAWVAATGAGDHHYGSYTIDAAGKWTYTADDSNTAVNALDDGDTLTDSFTIETVDGTTATVEVTITGSNDAPQLDHAIADQSVDEDHAVLFEVPADAFSDPDAGETLTYSATLEGGAALPDWLSFNCTTRTFSGTPPQDFNGVLSVSVTASDGDASVSDTFDLTVNAVNDAPVNAIAGYSVNEDTPTQLTGLAVGDVDADSGTIQVTLSVDSGALSATSGGGVAVSGSGSGTIELTGTVAAINAFLAATAPTFTPTANASGDVGLTMTTTDNGNSGSGGALTDTDQVTINVVPVNDAPAGTDGGVTTLEDTAKTLNLSDFGFTDPNDSPADAFSAVTITTLPGTGSLTLGGVAVSAGQSVSIADIVAGNLTYTPAQDANGSTSFTFEVQDDGGTANGGTDLDQSANTLTISITPVNDAPVLTGAPAILPAGTEETPYTFSDADLLAGYTDIDGSDLRVSSLTAVNGTLDYDFDTGIWTFTPNDNFNGTVTLNYSVVDGHGGIATATNSFTLEPVNDAATFTDQDFRDVTEDDIVTVTSGQIFAIDVDAGESSLQPQSNVAGTYGSFEIAASGAWTYTLDNADPDTNALAAGQVETENFTVASADGTTTVVTVTVNGANDAAVISGAVTGTAVEDGAGASGDANSTDVDNDDDAWIAAAGAGAFNYGTYMVDATGHWTYAVDNSNAAVDGLNAGDVLTDTFVITTVDGTTATVTVTIGGADDAPPRVEPSDISLTPTSNPYGDVGLNTYDFLATLGATDPDPGAISFSIISQTAANGSASSNFSIVGGTLSGQDIGVKADFSVTVRATQAGDPAGMFTEETFHILTGTNGNSSEGLSGATGDDYLYGNGGGDMLFGLGGDDWLYGQSGTDQLFGDDGNDHLFGGEGIDTLTGGAGNDTFVILPKTTNATDVDRITDFGVGSDVIDISALDASMSLGGNQDFAWGGTTATANGLWYSYDAATNTTTIFGDTNGNAATAEFTLVLAGYNANSNPIHDDILGLS